MFNLLLADDEPLIRRGIKDLIDLKKLNIENVFEASNGKEAVEICYEHDIDLLLMDINMPVIDGLTASEMIKKDKINTYIIILTGYDYFEYAQAAIRAKVDDYILKPVSKKDIEFILKNTVDKLIQNRKDEELKNIVGQEISVNEENLIVEYFENHIFDKDLSLNKMAKDIGYSSNYLSVLIKDLYFMPFQDYVYKRRMERAKILLLSSNMRNWEIAQAIGIEDVNYFITKFKKYFAKTPKQYRQGIIDEEDI
ncbi:response regulator transcription factor [Peptoniphilaceae bacterium SGI.131]